MSNRLDYTVTENPDETSVFHGQENSIDPGINIHSKSDHHIFRPDSDSGYFNFNEELTTYCDNRSTNDEDMKITKEYRSEVGDELHDEISSEGEIGNSNDALSGEIQRDEKICDNQYKMRNFPGDCGSENTDATSKTCDTKFKEKSVSKNMNKDIGEQPNEVEETEVYIRVDVTGDSSSSNTSTLSNRSDNHSSEENVRVDTGDEPDGYIPHGHPHVEPLESCVPVDLDHYDFSHQQCGYMVLIVNHRFVRQARRNGADNDLRNMKEIARKFGFKIFNNGNEINLTKRETIDLLERARRTDYSDCDCFAFMISTHGLEQRNARAGGRFDHALVCADDQLIFTSYITDKFSDENCPTLKNKPKFFFIQACRGENRDHGSKVLVESHRGTAKTWSACTDTHAHPIQSPFDENNRRYGQDSWSYRQPNQRQPKYEQHTFTGGAMIIQQEASHAAAKTPLSQSSFTSVKSEGFQQAPSHAHSHIPPASYDTRVHLRQSSFDENNIRYGHDSWSYRQPNDVSMRPQYEQHAFFGDAMINQQEASHAPAKTPLIQPGLRRVKSGGFQQAPSHVHSHIPPTSYDTRAHRRQSSFDENNIRYGQDSWPYRQPNDVSMRPQYEQHTYTGGAMINQQEASHAAAKTPLSRPGFTIVKSGGFHQAPSHAHSHIPPASYDSQTHHRQSFVDESDTRHTQDSWAYGQPNQRPVSTRPSYGQHTSTGGAVFHRQEPNHAVEETHLSDPGLRSVESVKSGGFQQVSSHAHSHMPPASYASLIHFTSHASSQLVGGPHDVGGQGQFHSEGFVVPNMACMHKPKVTPYAIVETPSLKCDNDMLVMFAIPPGMFAWRSKVDGSWLIHSVHKILMAYDMRRPKNFLNLLTKVTAQMSRRTTTVPSNHAQHGNKAVSVIEHKLTRDVFFQPKAQVPGSGSDWVRNTHTIYV